MGNVGPTIDVGHQRILQLRELFQDLYSFLVVVPRLLGQVLTVEPRVAQQQTESTPALVEVGSCFAAEASDVMSSETEAGSGCRQPCSQHCGHRRINGVRVASSVAGELLASSRAGTEEAEGIVFALGLFHSLENAFVVEVGIVVMHLHWVGAVEEHHALAGNGFGEIRRNGISIVYINDS